MTISRRAAAVPQERSATSQLYTPPVPPRQAGSARAILVRRGQEAHGRASVPGRVGKNLLACASGQLASTVLEAQRFISGWSPRLLRAHRAGRILLPDSARALHAPTHLLQRSPHRTRRQAHAELALDQHRNPRQLPRLRGIPGRDRPGLEELRQALELRVGQNRRSPDPLRPAQTPQTVLLEQSAPAHHRLSRRLDPSGHFGGPYTLTQQLRRQPSAPLQLLQRRQISLGTHALPVSHHSRYVAGKPHQECHPFTILSSIYRIVILLWNFQ